MRTRFPYISKAQTVCFQKDEYSYFINYNIVPHFRSVLNSNIKKSYFYAISIDKKFGRGLADWAYGSCSYLLGQCCQ